MGVRDYITWLISFLGTVQYFSVVRFSFNQFILASVPDSELLQSEKLYYLGGPLKFYCYSC